MGESSDMDDFSRQEMELLLSVYREQTLQLLEEMSQAVLDIERGEADTEVMASLRRAAHTIKGDSACIGLEGITEIMHALEGELSAGGEGNVKGRKEMVDCILDALDLVKESVESEEIRDIAAHSVEDFLGKLEGARGKSTERPPKFGEKGRGGANSNKEVGSALTEKKATTGKRREYVRVEAAKLDALLNLAGEMVIARSRLNRLEHEIEEALPKSEITSRFHSSGAHMGRLIGELQKSVLKMRMVTIDQVFKRFARPMRELALESGKQVEVETSGAETELDRALVDIIYEPLLHLLRNSVDHGIESREERAAIGKPETGKLMVRAFHEGNQVVIEVRDDGRGIDTDALKRKAVECGILAEAEALDLSEEDALGLIFRDGFSTAGELTRVSGRGIGAGAVKSSIEQVRGSVSVWSHKGIGASFTLRMPLTLAIVRALLFVSAGKLLALPLISVSEVARAQRRDTRFLDGFESYRLRDRFISLVRPGDVLGYERRKGGAGAGLREADSPLFVIVVGAAGRSYGVVADELLGEQELVIKPLEGEWVRNESVTGASVLGDGRVALIMDPEAMLRRSVRHEREKRNGLRAYAG